MEKTIDSETTGILVLDSLASMDDDVSLGTPERSAAIHQDVLSTYLDADGLCHDRVIKRVYKLKELFDRHVEANERSNMSAQAKATPVLPSEGS